MRNFTFLFLQQQGTVLSRKPSYTWSLQNLFNFERSNDLRSFCELLPHAWPQKFKHKSTEASVARVITKIYDLISLECSAALRTGHSSEARGSCFCALYLLQGDEIPLVIKNELLNPRRAELNFPARRRLNVPRTSLFYDIRMSL